MKKFLAREFLWFFAALFLSILLAFIFLSLLDVVSDETMEVHEEEKVFMTELYLLGYIISFIGVYLVRFVAAAIKVIFLPKDK